MTRFYQNIQLKESGKHSPSILRELNLGIPMLSPKVSAQTEVSSEMECH